MNEVFEILDQLLNLKDFDVDGIGKVLKAKFEVRPDANPYYHFYTAAIDRGPFCTAEFSRPGKGATKHFLLLTLEVRPGVEVSRKEVKSRYGLGEIARIIPEKKPEGVVIYRYRLAGQRVSFEFTGKTEKLLSVVICRGPDC